MKRWKIVFWPVNGFRRQFIRQGRNGQKAETGDSFSGILAEKLQDRMGSGKNSYRPARVISHDKPGTTIQKDLKQERVLKRSVLFQKSRVVLQQVRAKPQSGSSGPRRKKTTEKKR